MQNDGGYFLGASRTEEFYRQAIEAPRVVSYGRRISRGRFVENPPICPPENEFQLLAKGKILEALRGRIDFGIPVFSG